MSGFGRCWLTAWLLGWLGSNLTVCAQVPPALRKPVQLTPGRRSLGAVLAELSRQSRLPFSYSSSLVPLAHRYSVRPGPARPAGVVLREVLASEHLTYGLLAGQVVLWPDRAPMPPGVTAVNSEAASTETAGASMRQAGALMQPAASHSTAARPSFSPNTKPLAPYVATGETGRSASGRQSNRKYGVSSPPPTSAVGRKVTASIKQPAIAPTGALSKPSTHKGRVASASLAARAANPRIFSPSTAKTAAATSIRPNSSSRSRVSKRVSRAPAHTGRLEAFPLPKTPRAASGNASALAQLPLKQVDLQLGTQANTWPPALSLPAEERAGLAASPPPPPTPERHLDLSNLWKGAYLHGEAWVSESLPLGAVAKVGVARAYLVLGVAIAPAERHAGGAWGVGLGTAGRARGRFTPSLDLVQWFLGHDGDMGAGPTYLTQLRPQLAWQLRREGRLALVFGPTFNLATADSHGAQRGSFGHNQWLWVDEGGEHSSVRFWPGVQVGVRF